MFAGFFQGVSQELDFKAPSKEVGPVGSPKSLNLDKPHASREGSWKELQVQCVSW